MVFDLGGPADFVANHEAHLARAPVETAALAPRSGFVTGIATRDIGLAVVSLGGGRSRPDDKVDPAVGFTRLLPVGSEVRRGEALALVHARRDGEGARAAASVVAAYTIGETKPQAGKSVIRRIAPLG
jgi:thymidine phosphorylase